MTDVRVLILAGGKGTRMGAAVPKALVPICGKPIIDYILDAVEKSGIDTHPAVVIGHDLETLRQHVGDRAELVIQYEQHGTGHAVMVAREALRDAKIVLVVYGDHALYTADTYRSVAHRHVESGATITMLTTMLPDYHDWRNVYAHFGRILRGNDGDVIAIKEEKLCTEEERAITEVNNGMYCFDGTWLWDNIDDLSNDNAKGEYLLTDLIATALHQGCRVETVACPPELGIGVNTPEEVAIAERVLCEKS